MSKPRASRDPAARPLMLMTSAFAILAVALVVLTVERVTDERRAGGSAGAIQRSSAIGPDEGADVDEYEADRSAELRGLRADRAAVASLTSYRRASAVGRVLDGVAADAGPIVVVRWLVAVPGGPPQATGTDLRGWAAAVSAQAAEERAALEALLPTVEPGSPFVEFYRQEIERLAGLAVGVDPDGEFVFAVGVRAPAPALRQLAEEGEVRLVDVGPESAGVSSWRGLRPEELERAGDPPVRPAG